ncbi:LLM class flavin-dependent oxidoreductase [Iodidimonas sp. SYSU 1G8]|uniref:LLM class flavin-dependent oxidoreductase n=1 Tax=Iodidimonas sp. SYSU 1G8 TaxID=3133967 RepID=UPI0031FE7C50
MEYFANYNTGIDLDPADWASAREAEGFDGVVVSDHFWVGDKPYPHVWVTLTRIACATTGLRFGSSFCNNLFRSPVEFAQASLTLHQAAKGRFEAGLGAGWSESEVSGGLGQYYPGPGERASRYREAMTVVREIFDTGKCTFQGEHYKINVPVIGPYNGTAPLLVGSAGGPRTRREITPIVDRVEVFAGDFIRGGSLDFAALARVTDDDVKEMVAKVREIDADIPIGYFTLMAAGESEPVKGLEAMLGDGFASGLVGHPEKVAAKIDQMASWGFGRVQLTELVPGSYTNLAPYIRR